MTLQLGGFARETTDFSRGGRNGFAKATEVFCGFFILSIEVGRARYHKGHKGFTGGTRFLINDFAAWRLCAYRHRTLPTTREGYL